MENRRRYLWIGSNRKRKILGEAARSQDESCFNAQIIAPLQDSRWFCNRGKRSDNQGYGTICEVRVLVTSSGERAVDILPSRASASINAPDLILQTRSTDVFVQGLACFYRIAVSGGIFLVI